LRSVGKKHTAKLPLTKKDIDNIYNNFFVQSPYEADVFLRPLSFLLKTVFYILITLLSLCSNKDECILHVCVFLHGLSYCVELDFIS